MSTHRKISSKPPPANRLYIIIISFYNINTLNIRESNKEVNVHIFIGMLTRLTRFNYGDGAGAPSGQDAGPSIGGEYTSGGWDQGSNIIGESDVSGHGYSGPSLTASFKNWVHNWIKWLRAEDSRQKRELHIPVALWGLFGWIPLAFFARGFVHAITSDHDIYWSYPVLVLSWLISLAVTIRDF
jgi:hypothetical protein